MHRFKNIAVLSAMTMMMLFGTLSAHAAQDGHWQQNNGVWKYINKDGSITTNEWRESNGYEFWLGSSGTIMTDILVHDEGNIFYAGSKGQKIKSQWRYLQDQDGGFYWFYFDGSGNAVKGSSGSFGTTVLNGRTYAFDEDGHMLSGWVNKEDSASDTKDETAWESADYYFGPETDGAMSKGWRKVSVEDSDGESHDYWFWFDEDGKKTKKTRRTVTGKIYSFDPDDGHMITEWGTKDGKVSSSSDKIRYMASDGEQVQGRWVYAVPDENYDQEDYDDNKYSWWYMNSSGYAVKNGIKKINGLKYAFDSIGRMLTGLVIKNSSTPESLKTDDENPSFDEFESLDGPVYYFSEDTSTLGKMKTGNQKIELSDDTYDFYFDASSGAGKTGYIRKINKYTINGAVISPKIDDEDMRYGFIPVKKQSDGTYTPLSGRVVYTIGTGTYVLIGRSGSVLKNESSYTCKNADDTTVYTVKTDSDGVITEVKQN